MSIIMPATTSATTPINNLEFYFKRKASVRDVARAARTVSQHFKMCQCVNDKHVYPCAFNTCPMPNLDSLAYVYEYICIDLYTEFGIDKTLEKVAEVHGEESRRLLHLAFNAAQSWNSFEFRQWKKKIYKGQTEEELRLDELHLRQYVNTN